MPELSEERRLYRNGASSPARSRQPAADRLDPSRARTRSN